MNTNKQGTIRFIIFKEKSSSTYTGVCLDFGIVIEDKDISKVQKELLISARGYLETIQKENMDDSLLNNQAEKKYFHIYERFLEFESAKSQEKKKRILAGLDKNKVSVKSTSTVTFPDYLDSNICYA